MLIKLFSSFLPDFTVFSTSTFVTLRFGLFTESWKERNISKLYIFWNCQGCSILYFKACLQLVKVTTVFVFLGRGLLVKDTESQEDQYLYEICPCEHSDQICHQIAISCVSSLPSHFTACQLESVTLLYLCGRGLLAQSTEFQDGQNNKNFLMCSGQKSRRFQFT